MEIISNPRVVRMETVVHDRALGEADFRRAKGAEWRMDAERVNRVKVVTMQAAPSIVKRKL